MLWKNRWGLISASALVASAALLTLSGCAGKSREDTLSEAADAINAAIEQDLALERYEFSISQGVLFDEKNYDTEKTTYICVAGKEDRDYYITTVPSSEETTLTAEHLLLGSDHYHRLFDRQKNEYYISPDAENGESGQPELLDRGWMYDSESSSASNEYYKKRLWIYGYRISPEDFAEASIDKEGSRTTISLSRSPEQIKNFPLPSKLMYDEAMEWYQKELAKDNLKQYEKSSLEAKKNELEEAGAKADDFNYTAETLEAVIDSSGRLLSVRYRLTCDYEQEIDGKAVKTMTRYSDAVLERSNDESIVLPE